MFGNFQQLSDCTYCNAEFLRGWRRWKHNTVGVRYIVPLPMRSIEKGYCLAKAIAPQLEDEFSDLI